MSQQSKGIDSPIDRDLKVMQYLRAFHEDEESSGYFYKASQILIDRLDALYGVAPTPLPDLSSDVHG